MKAKFSTPLVTFELEAATQKELFKTIADTQEVFGESKCGLCSSPNIKFVVRTIDGNDYHEFQCAECGAKLSLGQSKQRPGHLFPIRKLTREGKPSRKDGTYDAKNKGWTKYRGVEPDKD